MTFKSEKVGIVGHFQEKLGKVEAQQKVGKGRHSWKSTFPTFCCKQLLQVQSYSFLVVLLIQLLSC